MSRAMPLEGAAVGFTLCLGGSGAIVALKTGDIYVVDLSGGTPPAPLLKLTGTPAGIALSPDGARAFIPRSDKKADDVSLTSGTASPNPITTAIGPASHGIALPPQADRSDYTSGGKAG